MVKGPAYAVKLGSFDAVWAIMASYAGFAALRYKKQNPKVPFLLTLQEGDTKWHIYKHVWWCWSYFKQIFQRADRIQAISGALKVWAVKLGAKNSVSIVPNGVALDRFGTADQSMREKAAVDFRAELGIPLDAKIMFTASRLVPKNGVGDVIKSLFYLPYSVHAVIVGSGELESELRRLADVNHVTERVHFLGSKSHSDLPHYLWGSTLFCRPSLSEGLGNSFLEAMAAGVPVIATPVGGIPDFLTDGVTGWFCKVKNPKSIADKVLFLLREENKAEVDRVTANAQKLIAEKYTWDTVAGQMKQIFETL
jgi:glycosyltransferase involved in cell wall biosynthesis